MALLLIGYLSGSTMILFKLYAYAYWKMVEDIFEEMKIVSLQPVSNGNGLFAQDFFD